LNPEQRASAEKAFAQGLSEIRTAVDYWISRESDLRKRKVEGNDASREWTLARSKLLYEAAWGWRILAEREIEAARSKLQQERWQKRREELSKGLAPGQPPPQVALPQVPLRELPLGDEEEKRLRGFQFLSQKPMLWVLNLGEAEAPRLREIEAEFRTRVGQRPRTAITAVCGKIEAELSELSPEEAQQYRESFGLPDSGLQRLVEATFSLLGLISFFTGSQPEVRAWTVPRNTTALKAAGAIHSDFEERFIRAEVISWKDLVAAGSLAAARERGLLRLEGKDYIVQDGDVLQIRHG
jgi:ribosome-binding ATPase YchF (GTP1/OBG family)